jgi:hypothetical protein
MSITIQAVEPIVVNRYLPRGEEATSRCTGIRVTTASSPASSGGFWLIADSIRYHRSDSSLVEVVVPVRSNDADAATGPPSNSYGHFSSGLHPASGVRVTLLNVSIRTSAFKV